MLVGIRLLAAIGGSGRLVPREGRLSRWAHSDRHSFEKPEFVDRGAFVPLALASTRFACRNSRLSRSPPHDSTADGSGTHSMSAFFFTLRWRKFRSSERLLARSTSLPRSRPLSGATLLLEAVYGRRSFLGIVA